MITSTYHPSGLLTMYTSHPVESTNSKHQTEYRMTQLRSFAMTDALDTFRQGAAAWRNGRELMEMNRGSFIAAVNAKTLYAETPGFESSTQSFVSLSSNDPTYPESETSADELALDIKILASSNHRITAGIQKNAQPKPSSNRYLKKNKGSQKSVANFV